MDFTLYNLFEQLFNWLVPTHCLACDQLEINANEPALETGFCRDCYDNLPFLENTCSQCGLNFVGPSDVCGSCLTSPPSYDACFCPMEYTAPISDLICRLKYGDQPQLAARLAELMVDQITCQGIELPDAIISVPMHNSKLRKRGYNQSTELAKQISRLIDRPFINNALMKSKATSRQATQTLKQRQNNVKNSFLAHKNLGFKHIAIVDDVVTTGATVEEISKILKKNGVDYIQVWGLARTL